MVKRTFGILAGVLVVSLLLIASASALQIRPINQVNHHGLAHPYSPPAQGPNHVGVSDYSNKWTGISELCEMDRQYRPANQGLNIPKFFSCFCGL